ncbi:hypothetical protein TruAng_006320 [Truncatella angustata]|nr:hypothetical protein TruAng_006320 [Truncatella angustata]
MHFFKTIITSILLSSFVSADFDMWLRQTCSIDGPGSGNELCTFHWVTLPAYNGDYCEDYAVQSTLGDEYDQPCDKWMTMDGGGQTIIHNCANNYNQPQGSYYGDVLHYKKDGTTVAGTCQIWNGQMDQGMEVAITCGSSVYLWTSRIACKISGVYGTA